MSEAEYDEAMQAAAMRRWHDPEFAARVHIATETVMRQTNSNWDRMSVYAGACMALHLAETEDDSLRVPR